MTAKQPTLTPIAPSGIFPTSEGNEAYTIQLQSRQFVPEAGVESGLETLRDASTERVHVLIQLFETPDEATKTGLESSGINLLNFIPRNAWFASVPKTLQADDPAISLIRWIGPILPEDKLSTTLREGKISSWALRENDRIALDISIFEDISLSDAEQIILTYDGQVVGSTPLSNKLTIEVSKDVINSLATEDVVRWIDLVPPPPTTD